MSGIKERIKCVSLEVILSFQDVKSHRGGEIKVGHHYQYMYNFYRGPNDKDVLSFFHYLHDLGSIPLIKKHGYNMPKF